MTLAHRARIFRETKMEAAICHDCLWNARPPATRRAALTHTGETGHTVVFQSMTEAVFHAPVRTRRAAAAAQKEVKPSTFGMT